MANGGVTPILSKEELIRVGYGAAIFPAAGFLAATAALDAVYETLRRTGSTADLDVPLYPFADMNRLMGFEEVRSEEHTSELQSLMRTSYAVFCLKKKTNKQQTLQN